MRSERGPGMAALIALLALPAFLAATALCALTLLAVIAELAGSGKAALRSLARSVLAVRWRFLNLEATAATVAVTRTSPAASKHWSRLDGGGGCGCGCCCC